MTWKKAFQKGREIVLATCSKNNAPNAIVVISLGLVDGKILIACCQMKQTLKNIKKNKKVCIVAKINQEYYKIKGNAKVYYSGKYYESAVKVNSGPCVMCAIVVDVKEVFDLDRVKVIKK